MQAEFGPAGGTIGRAQACDLVLADPSRHISRVQARVAFAGHGWVLTDRGSALPVIKDGVEIGRHASVPVADGDSLTIGEYEFARRGPLGRVGVFVRSGATRSGGRFREHHAGMVELFHDRKVRGRPALHAARTARRRASGRPRREPADRRSARAACPGATASGQGAGMPSGRVVLYTEKLLKYAWIVYSSIEAPNTVCVLAQTRRFSPDDFPSGA